MFYNKNHVRRCDSLYLQSLASLLIITNVRYQEENSYCTDNYMRFGHCMPNGGIIMVNINRFLIQVRL